MNPARFSPDGRARLRAEKLRRLNVADNEGRRALWIRNTARAAEDAAAAAARASAGLAAIVARAGECARNGYSPDGLHWLVGQLRAPVAEVEQAARDAARAEAAAYGAGQLLDHLIAHGAAAPSVAARRAIEATMTSTEAAQRAATEAAEIVAALSS